MRRTEVTVYGFSCFYVPVAQTLFITSPAPSPRLPDLESSKGIRTGPFLGI